MQLLPIPCPADQVPDATGTERFNAAYKAAKDAGVTYVGIERRGRSWTVKTDRAPGHVVTVAAACIIRKAVVRLLLNREVRNHASAGPDYVQLNGVASEQRARELAAALHSALYGDPEPLARAVPGMSS
ncbi:hypothetical protein AQJ46_42190 [Streptomyces canus]|uniref:Uncharacterized protein n=1 Tax=Streptomyces canus TaxID=58343 RepID=A0A117QWY6_9ACTN|nr:hypothetical protein [Streptomyces canus]KUN58886.1 hypothetical protein AQJ46_42190 [Streptomyces canus]